MSTNIKRNVGVIMIMIGAIFYWVTYYPHDPNTVTVGDIMKHWDYWGSMTVMIAGIYIRFLFFRKTTPRKT